MIGLYDALVTAERGPQELDIRADITTGEAALPIG